MQVAALVFGRLGFLDRDPVGVRPGVLPCPGDLPGHLLPGAAARDRELQTPVPLAEAPVTPVPMLAEWPETPVPWMVVPRTP